jgi:hypothetical protein
LTLRQKTKLAGFKHCDMPKSENISPQTFREHFIIVVAVILEGPRKSGGYYLIKAPQEIMVHVSYSLRAHCITLCQSQFYEPCIDKGWLRSNAS